tara:strand:+ start:2397 stop:2894 length:498 start_codon:yes stop_codon:yes gene_type:complete
MQFDSKIKTIDIVNSSTPLVINLSGKFEISYANHFTDEKDFVNTILEIFIEDSILNIDINLEFTYQSECARCLSKKENKMKNSKSFKLNIDIENDYEINFDNEYIDIEPFISEIIIDNLDTLYICSNKCKGLCGLCGTNMNEIKCNCEEKNLKESPFSSLSQLDL